jgi:hypothetical protein
MAVRLQRYGKNALPTGSKPAHGDVVSARAQLQATPPQTSREEMRRVIADRDKLNTELIQLRAEAERVRVALERSQAELASARAQSQVTPAPTTAPQVPLPTLAPGSSTAPRR